MIKHYLCKKKDAMNTISVTNSTYKGMETYAKVHNISMSDAVERGLKLLISQINKPKPSEKKEDLASAFAFIDTIPARGGRPIPGDERGIDALIEKKYAK